MVGPFRVVLVTASALQEAKNIASSLLQSRLIACANLVPSITSMYWWQGKIETGDEVLMVMKTTEDKVPSVIEQVKKLHSYGVPEIEDGSVDYLQWVKDEVEKAEL